MGSETGVKTKKQSLIDTNHTFIQIAPLGSKIRANVTLFANLCRIRRPDYNLA